MPDSYLDELQEALAMSSGVQVSRSTVWRTLRRAGFTMKKVIMLLYQFVRHIVLTLSGYARCS